MTPFIRVKLKANAKAKVAQVKIKRQKSGRICAECTRRKTEGSRQRGKRSFLPAFRHLSSAYSLLVGEVGFRRRSVRSCGGLGAGHGCLGLHILNRALEPLAAVGRP